MHVHTVATIKDKAVSAKNATAAKIQNTRDKHSSTPMAKTRFVDAGYMPKAGSPPPPPRPGARRSFNASRGSLEQEGAGSEAYGHEGREAFAAPPPVMRSTKPSLNARSASPPSPPPSRGLSVLERARAFKNPTSSPSSPTLPPPAPQRTPSQRWSQPAPKALQIPSADNSTDANVDIDKVDWTNLSPKDKEAFFGWLDEFFAQYIEKMRGVHSESNSTEGGEVRVVENTTRNSKTPPTTTILAPPAQPVRPASGAPATSGRGAPPPIKSWSKPTVEAAPSYTHSHDHSQPKVEFKSSYPPPTTCGSQALDLACYFHPSTEWDTPWYASQGALPPLLQTNPHRLYKAQMISRGDTRSITFAVLFCDLSAAWVSVSYSNSTTKVAERSAKYLDAPEALNGEELRGASEVYGETIARYAESFLGSGQFCGRGECWDLAAEALKFVTSSASPSIPAPIPSLGRTHGHLIFVGRASRGGRHEGQWRGGDDRVRRGDIVEWRSVRIARVGDQPGGYAILGDPEHTAVVTRDCVPYSPQLGVYDGAPLEPRALRSLEVVEQSLNDPPEPARRTYDLNRFEEGEMWIYRPVSMATYLGFEELVCEAPPHALSI
ncbi:hypothetical protein ACEPAF_8904 [Sanghuangporus sanghuang]